MLNIFNIGTDTPMQFVGIGIPQMRTDFDGDLAKQRHRMPQRIPIVCYRRTGVGLLHLGPDVRRQALFQPLPQAAGRDRPAMIELHAPFEHLPQIDVLHVVVQAPLGRQELVAPQTFGHVRCIAQKIIDQGLVGRR